jgi:DNA replication ATP-dependent helicase Dna2
MLKRLAEKHPDSVCQLTFQYRMHEDICQLSNDIVYAGSLKCGNDDVRYRKLDLPGFPENMGNIGDVATNAWLMRSVDPDFPVVFLDTDKIRLDLSSKGEGLEALERTLRNRDGGSIVNYVEARIVQLIVEGFLSCGIEAQAVGVICPFRAQVSRSVQYAETNAIPLINSHVCCEYFSSVSWTSVLPWQAGRAKVLK